MSHPFTLEYMLEGKTSSNRISGSDINQKEIEGGTEMPEIQRTSRQRSRIDQHGQGVQRNQTEETPDGDMEEIKEEMNITITDQDRMSFLKILRIGIRRRLEIFAEEVSIVGLSYFFKPANHKIGSIIRKVVWTLLLLFATGFMVFQIYDRISFYLTYPTLVKYQVAYNRSLRFPTVTICSQVLFSKMALFSIGNKINFN